MTNSSDIYPQLEVKHIQNPNRIYALPLIGWFIKFVICIPQFIMLFFIGIAWFFCVMLINPFVVLLTGKYWNVAYTITVSLFNVSTKLTLYFFGLTDKYPGFDTHLNDDISLHIAKPENPSRLFSFPLIGGIVRFILLIPYFIYLSVMEFAAGLGIIGSSFVVLFTGKYPESIYELSRDYTRLSLALTQYYSGLSDAYPSFWISMNHKNIKIALIALAVLYNLFYYGSAFASALTGEQKMDTYQSDQDYSNSLNNFSEEDMEYSLDEETF